MHHYRELLRDFIAPHVKKIETVDLQSQNVGQHFICNLWSY